MKVFVKSRGRNTLVFKLEDSSSVYYLKTLIQSQLTIPASEQVLLFNNQDIEVVLEDETTLFQNQIPNRSCIILKRINDSHSRSQSHEEPSTMILTIDRLRRYSLDICTRNDPFRGFFENCKAGDYHSVARDLEYNPQLSGIYSTEGWMALHYSAFTGSKELTELILDYDADVNALTRDGKFSSLHLSCIQGHLGVTDFLLSQKNIEVDLFTEENGTPLHCACLSGHFPIVQLLLLAKANYSIENSLKQLPVELASNNEIRGLLNKYMGETSDLPETFEGELSTSSLFHSKKVWGVLKPLEGLICFFSSKTAYKEGKSAISIIDLKQVREAKRCKGGFFSNKNQFYFSITTSKSKHLLFSDCENVANIWVRNIFAALLFKQNRKKLHLLQNDYLEEFPFSPGINYHSFEVLQQIGSGNFGTVYLVKKKDTSEKFALKSMLKERLVKKNYMKYAITEANILKEIECPFIVKLHYCFQTSRSVYLVMEHCPRGTLADLLQKLNYLPETYARIYIAELVVAIEYLHERNVIFRDLKPENILLDKNWHIKLVDFGLAREIEESALSKSFCGSPAYLSPEMLNKTGVGKKTDIYGIGCILFELLAGYPPYYSDDISHLLHRINNAKLKFPKYVKSVARDLLKQLLDRDPQNRPGIGDLKQHQFFGEVDWNYLASGNLPNFDWKPYSCEL